MMARFKINPIRAFKWDGTFEGIEEFKKTFPELTFKILSNSIHGGISTLAVSGAPFNEFRIYKNGEYLFTGGLSIDGWWVYDPVDGIQFYRDREFDIVFDVEKSVEGLGFC
jgi:hypothetical protein